MIPNNQKTSLLVPFQLPEYIRDDPNYATFNLFLQAYYQWMEQPGNVTDAAKNLLNYDDIDNTSAAFVNYYINDFLPNFPANILANKQKAVKVAKQLYQSKGTPAAYKFLFRVLYNSDVDFFYTKDAILKASSGTWYVAQSLKLLSTDTNYLATNNLRIFGETTKSIATIENCTISGTRIQVFISNIQRLFQSGEYVRIVDSNNQNVYFLNGEIVSSNTIGAEILRSKIVGQISQININPLYQGSLYVPGDPVIVYGGLNTLGGHGAIATVGSTTTGSLQSIKIVSEGYGYTGYSTNTTPGAADSVITFGNINTGGQSPVAQISTLDPSANGIANVTLIPIDSISLMSNVAIGNANNLFAYTGFSANANSNYNSTFANTFTFASFTTRPISSVVVYNAGGGLLTVPTITAQSLYYSNISTAENLADMGILSPIQIANPGTGYRVNDQIVFSSSPGFGAYANVTAVATNGAITSVSYVWPSYLGTQSLPLGGVTYNPAQLPALTVNSANTQAANASLFVPGILGTGAVFSGTTNRVGNINTINISDYGQDYVAAPNVSLIVEDLLITNVSSSTIAVTGDIVYQGSNLTSASYSATVASSSSVTTDTSANGVYSLRVYNYAATPNASLPLLINGKSSVMTLTTKSIPSNWLMDGRYAANTTPFMLAYGDGTAQANASFLNGLVISQGQYLDTTGQLSSYSLLQSQQYNNYTYEITLEKEIAAYRNTLLNLLHPAGLNVIGRYAIKSNTSMTYSYIDAVQQGALVSDLMGANTTVTLSGSFTNPSNNIINFSSMNANTNLANILTTSSTIRFTDINGVNVYSEIVAVNGSANNIQIRDNVWVSFANVANISAPAGNTIINITSLTGSYNVVNNGLYSNTLYPLMDIIHVGDTISIPNNSNAIVNSINYLTNTITLGTGIANTTNGLMSVTRTITQTGPYIQIFTPVGIQYTPEITTETVISLTTESGITILLG